MIIEKFKRKQHRSIPLKLQKRPDTVVCACHLSYSGRGDWEDHVLRPAQAKK
jgi:hypothetical protein